MVDSGAFSLELFGELVGGPKLSIKPEITKLLLCPA